MGSRLPAKLSALASAGLALAALLTTAACGAHAANDVADTNARVGETVDLGESVLGRFLAARHAEAVGNLPAAAQLAEALLADLGDEPALQRRTYILLLSAGSFDEAVSVARRGIESFPEDPIARLTLATDALGDEAFDEAIAQLERIEANGANRILGPLLMAWALAGKSDYAAAAAELDTFAQVQGLAPIARLHAALIVDLSGDAVRTEAAYDAAKAAAGGEMSLQLTESYAAFLMRVGRGDEARALYETFEARHPGSILLEPLRAMVAKGGTPERPVATVQAGAAEALHAVATLLDREDMDSQGLLLTRLSLHLRPDNPPAQYLLGQLLESDRQPALAIDAYRRIDPDSPFGWFARLNIAEMYQSTDRPEQAVKQLTSMMAERPERADVARALGDVYRMEREFEQAVEAYDAAVERSDAIDWRLLYTRGIALERSDQWERAERDFLRALEMEPDQPLVLNYLGYSWVEKGIHLDRAREMIERAVAQRPEDGFITDSLGWVLFRMGDYKGAVTHLERAVMLEPSDPVINDHLGDVYWLVGRKNEARFQWKRALSQDPDDDLAGEIRDKLEGRAEPRRVKPGEGRDI